MAVINVSPVVSTDQAMKEGNGTIQLCMGLDVPASMYMLVCMLKCVDSYYNYGSGEKVVPDVMNCSCSH